MKKLLYILLILVILPFLYLCSDYAAYMFKPRNAIKKILIISEPLQPGSARAKLAEAIIDVAAENSHISTTLVTVDGLGFSFLSGDNTPRQHPIDDPQVKQWSSVVAASDGFIFLVPNYNNGYPAGIKNAIDVLWKEWFNKPAGIVAYSSSENNSSEVIHSFGRVLDKIKSDPVKTVIDLSARQVKNLSDSETLALIKQQFRQLIAEMYTGTHERHYLKQLYRSVTDKMLVKMIQFFHPKKR